MSVLLRPLFLSICDAAALETSAKLESAVLRFGQLGFALVSTEFGRQAAAGHVELTGAKLSGKKAGSVTGRVSGMSTVGEWLVAWTVATVKHQAKYGTTQPLTSLPSDERLAVWFTTKADEAVKWAVERAEAEAAAEAAKKAAKAGAK